MTISAVEAHDKSQKIIDVIVQEVIENVDERIKLAVESGEFFVHLPKMHREIKQEVVSHYRKHGYDTEDNSYFVTLKW